MNANEGKDSCKSVIGVGVGQRWHRGRAACLALVLAALLCPACSKRDPAGGGAPAAAALAPVPAPEGLLAEVLLAAPDATWGKARAAVGGQAMFLPPTFGGLAATLIGLPITVAGEIDGNVPVLGAVVDFAPRPHAVLGLHVKVGDRLIDLLTKGDTARYVARHDPATSITLLELKDGRTEVVALGVLGNYLLVGRTGTDVTAVGPYVARTMPRMAPPKEDLVIEVPPSAFQGPAQRWLAQASENVRALRDQAGSSPLTYLADPLLEIVQLLGDLKRARVAVELDGARLGARVTMTPAAGGGPAATALRDMLTGDATPLLELPSETLVAFVARESPASRTRSARAQAGAVVGLLGIEPAAAGREPIEAALVSLAESRGDWLAGGLSLDASGPAAYVRASASNPEKLTKGLSALVATTKLGGVKAGLAAAQIVVSSSSTTLEGVVGEVVRVRFARAKKDAKQDLPSSVELLYRVEGEVLYAAAGMDAKPAIVRVMTSAGKSDLTTTPIRDALVPLGPEVAFALVLEPLRIVASRAGKRDAGGSAPVVLAFGRDAAAENLWARLDLANAALREAIRLQGAL